jgi:hypothetical protein
MPVSVLVLIRLVFGNEYIFVVLYYFSGLYVPGPTFLVVDMDKSRLWFGRGA